MAQAWLQVAIFVGVVIALTPLLGKYMARVFSGERVFLSPVFGPVERFTYRVLRVDPSEEQDWKAYAKSLVLFSVFSWVALYLILRTQGIQPFNPEGFHSGPWDVSFNTASSFVSNTNWQYYGGETTLTYFAQMAGLTVENFVTPAVGICVLLAFIRGIIGRSGPGLGNFWQDLTRSLYYVLLPLSVIVGLILVSQGVVQTLSGASIAKTVEGAEQALAMGPAASQIAIKQLGTNGGGFFNVNSAHPFENANALTNFIELLSIILIPAALTYTYGKMVGRQREGWSIFAAMLAIYLAFVIVIIPAEQHGTPAEHAAGTPTKAIAGSTGGNMEGKEQRNGITESALWGTTTTVTSNGSVNSALDSFTGLGGAVPMSGLGTSEVVFGGVGTGLYSMLLYRLACGLHRRPDGRPNPGVPGQEDPGERDQAGLTRHPGHAARGALRRPGLRSPLEPACARSTRPGHRASRRRSTPTSRRPTTTARPSPATPASSSPTRPATSAAYGISFADLLGGATMTLARFLPIILVLAVAGSLAGKKVSPAGPGTMRTDTPTFVILLIGVVILVGALTFFPALLLGPIVQSLTTQLF